MLLSANLCIFHSILNDWRETRAGKAEWTSEESGITHHDCHTSIGDQVLSTTWKPVSQERTGHTCHEIPTCQSKIDLVLCSLDRDSDRGKHPTQIVRNKTIPRPLRERTNTRGDEDPSAIDAGCDKLLPGGFGTLQLHTNGLPNLVEFCSN